LLFRFFLLTVLRTQKHQRIEKSGIEFEEQNIQQIEAEKGNQCSRNKILLCIRATHKQDHGLHAMKQICEKTDDTACRQHLDQIVVIKIGVERMLEILAIVKGIVKSGAQDRIIQKMIPTDQPFFRATVIICSVLLQVFKKRQNLILQYDHADHTDHEQHQRDDAVLLSVLPFK